MAHFIEECKHELKEMRERCYIGVQEIEEWDAAAAEEDSADLLLERYENEVGAKFYIFECEALNVKFPCVSPRKVGRIDSSSDVAL